MSAFLQMNSYCPALFGCETSLQTNSDCRTEMKAVSIGDPTQMNTINAKNDFWHADRCAPTAIHDLYVKVLLVLD